MKTTIHARLSKEDAAALGSLKKSTGQSESELVRLGLRLVLREFGGQPSALDLAGDSTGKFRKGLKDLSTNKRHMQGFGE